MKETLLAYQKFLDYLNFTKDNDKIKSYYIKEIKILEVALNNEIKFGDKICYI